MCHGKSDFYEILGNGKLSFGWTKDTVFEFVSVKFHTSSICIIMAPKYLSFRWLSRNALRLERLKINADMFCTPTSLVT